MFFSGAGADKKRPQARLADLFYIEMHLCLELPGEDSGHFVQLLCKLALLVGGGVLVDDTAGRGLVNSLDGFLVSCLGGCLVARCDGGVELLDDRLELRVGYLVDECLLLDNENTLLCRFDVCHVLTPPVLIYAETVMRLRGRAVRLTVQYDITNQRKMQ